MNKKWIALACLLFVLFAGSGLFKSFDNSGNIEEKSEYTDLSDMPVEMVISRRLSIHYGDYYDLNTTVPFELVSKVLWAAYGYSWLGRTVPSFSGYPIVIYVCNETAAYKFIPENQSVIFWKEGDYRTIGGGYAAPIKLYIVLDMNICQNVTWGNAESGCTIQSIYLMANALNLGTVCCNIDQTIRPYIHQGLGLPQNEWALYRMPLGYPLPPYTNYQNLVPASRPSSPELPEIQDSTVSLEDALNSVNSSREWSENPVTKQELSQVLWASYGYSYYEDTAADPLHPARHRTVPSAHARYPMNIYAANSSGIYQYVPDPEQHTLTAVKAGDSRSNIAQASGNLWASSAPLIITIVWDETRMFTVNTTYVEVGLIAQNVYLESAAWGLITDWGKADGNEEAMREALGLTEKLHLHPVSIMTVGHPDITPPIISILSPENETYTVNDIPLTLTVNEATSWMGYSLDSQANETITGNTTLTGLSDGIHSITVYANDTAGNMGYSDTVYFTIDTVSPNIEILSPENKTYTTSSVPLSFTVDEATSWMGYSLDGQANVTIAGNTTLTGLSDGMHSLKVYASDIAGNVGYSDIVYFTIHTTPIDTTPPTISIVSPENKTYDTTDIPLTFTVDESVSWMAYSLDNNANVTITGNTTLSGLSDGSHSLIVYAKDTAGNTGASEIVYFSIETQQPEPFPTWTVAIIVITVVGATLLVYFAKVKKTTEKIK